MTLRSSLLRELENTHLSVNSRAELCCDVTRELENKGEYEEARKVLSDYWPRIGDAPKLAGLAENTAAELLLRAGVLTGIIGNQRQIANAQETAKDLITQSHSIFESRQNQKKIAEARTELAFCYWRTDDLNEARAYLKQAISLLTIDSELKAKAVLRLSNVEHSAEHDQLAFRILDKHARLFHRINNHTLKGCYFTALGNRLENLAESEKRGEYIDRALIEYAAASYHFELGGHRPYLASVENNLGFLYFRIDRYDQAHEHLDRARRIFGNLKDVGRAAQVDETCACVFLAEGRITEAERVSRSAVRVQEKSGNPGLLAEALITNGRALARLARYSASLTAFRRAVDLSNSSGAVSRAGEAALAAFNELGDHLVVSESGKISFGRSWERDKLSVEREVIKRALEQANGSITDAARALGTTWQTLGYALRTRHKDLLKYRTPVRRRSRRN